LQKKDKIYFLQNLKVLDDENDVLETKRTSGDEEEEDEELAQEFQHIDPESRMFHILLKSFMMMSLGTVVVLIFSDPMVEVLSSCGVVLGVNPF